MRTYYPDYYPRFSCIAGECRHSCCVGWEIDIDEASYRRFMAEDGTLGERLRANIEPGDEPHFVLGEDERCPFLRGDGLCDLIIEKGEGYLCDICAEHPRFYNFTPGRCEVGVGLTCEAAARLVLFNKEPVRLISEGEDEPEDEWYEAVLGLRQRVTEILQDRAMNLSARCEAAVKLLGGEVPEFNVGEWCETLLSLERLDEGWTELITRLREFGDRDTAEFGAYMSGRETEFEQLMVYLVYRHFVSAAEEGDAACCVGLAIFARWLVWQLGAMLYHERGEFTPEDMAEVCRAFSSEIEYSDENLQALLDRLVI